MSALQFAELCSNGYLELAQKCYQDNPGINIYYNGNQAFSGACRNGHLQIAKWIITILPNDTDYIKYLNISLSYGRVEMIIYISKYISDFNVSDNRHNIFYMARLYNHYHIIEWLHTIKPEVYTIDSQGIPHCYPEKDNVERPASEYIVPCSEVPTTWQAILPVIIYAYILFIFIVIRYVI